MDKVYNHKDVEERIYEKWEKKGYFTPKIDKKSREARSGSARPFSIILPPPNANAPLHFGHAMYVIEDILIRYHRMKGDPTLWLPGADHAGFETQFVFEKKLKEKGKSRFDYDQKTLYKMIWEYVQKNKVGMESQLRRLGFSLDWTRNKFTLDEDIIKIVYQTFKKLYEDGLVYRGDRLVNYCTRCGTSFSDLEVDHKEQKDPLYYIKYGPFVLATVRPETKFGDTAVAVNPKDKRYKKWIGKEIEAQSVIGKFKVGVIADEMIDPNFGTGVAKVTPAHDMKDFEIGLRHNLKRVQVIGLDGKLNEKTGKYKGLYIKQARKLIAQDLRKMGLIEKIDENYTHTIEVCYKCGTTIEPMLLPQWFIKMRPLAKPAIDVVKKGKIKIFPKRFEKIYFQFLENIKDWNISRQIVWGIRIPAWFREWKPSKDIPIMGFHERTESQVLLGKTKTYRLKDYDFRVGDKVALENSQAKKIFGYGTIVNMEETTVGKLPLDDKAHGVTYKKRTELIEALKFHNFWLKINEETKAWIYTYSFGRLKNGRVQEIYIGEDKPPGESWIQDEDTFDTWFSSSQWPFATLRTTKRGDFKYFYPTKVMETGYDILRWWVARMVMVGLYATGKIPFEHIVLHGLVNDPLGKKMSKSKGNVVNPLELVDQYGADAVRFALIYGNATGNDQSLSYSKLDAARKFTNKIWNMARFIEMNRSQKSTHSTSSGLMLSEVEASKVKSQKYDNNLTIEQLNNIAKHENDKSMIKKTGVLIREISNDLDKYQFNLAAERLYDFAWHEFADKYIEDVKNRIDANSFMVLSSLFLVQLKLLHPFMPFVTEEIYQRFVSRSEILLRGSKSIMIDKWPTY